MSCAPYTGPDAAASCHQCKTRRRLVDLYFCSHMPSRTRACRKKYCKLCLDKFYVDAKPKLGEELFWKCPSCMSTCTCASCQREMNAANANIDNKVKKPRTISHCHNINDDYVDLKPKIDEELIWKCPSCVSKCTCATSDQRETDGAIDKDVRKPRTVAHYYDINVAAKMASNSQDHSNTIDAK